MVTKENRWIFSAAGWGPSLRVVVSSIVTAYDASAIGSKVIAPSDFASFLFDVISEHDFSTGKTPGQALLKLPKAALQTVSCGVGKRTLNPADYHARLYRGKVGLFLDRKHAVKAKSLQVVLYTWDAYLKDPDVNQKEITLLSKGGTPTHVVVAVLASPSTRPQLSPSGFVHNLAGGNNDFKPSKLTVHGLINKAREIEKYASDWIAVADRELGNKKEATNEQVRSLGRHWVHRASRLLPGRDGRRHEQHRGKAEERDRS